jgi:hypothetical protein
MYVIAETNKVVRCHGDLIPSLILKLMKIFKNFINPVPRKTKALL